MSIDEQRNDFAPLRFNDRLSQGQRLKEVWFAGAHADIGGGYHDAGGLEYVSRQWMMTELAEYQLFPKSSTDPDSACQQFEGNAHLNASCDLGRLHDEFLDGNLFGKFGLHWRHVNRGDRLHGSVVCRFDAPHLPNKHPGREPKGQYRPENLYYPLLANYVIEPYPCPVVQEP